VSEQTLTPEQRAELARLASEADLPWRAKGHWVHSNADVVAMAEDSEQGGRDVQFIVAACNAVPQLMADLAAAEQERDRLAMDALYGLGRRTRRPPRPHCRTGGAGAE
jgi:hypothetical protein